LALTDDLTPLSTDETYDCYDLGDRLLMVAHDRLYFAGHAFPGLIPNKGRASVQLAVFWHSLFEGFFDSSFISADTRDLPAELSIYADELNGRFMLFAKPEMFPIKACVYGYLTHPVLGEYQQAGTVGGVDAEPGLTLNSFLEQCIYIPYLTEPGQIDQQIDLMKTVELFGMADGMKVCATALEIYKVIHGLAKSRGVVFAEIRLAFGLLDDTVVVTEVPSADNSLLWSTSDVEAFPCAEDHELYAFRELNDWLQANWDYAGEAPELPEQLVETLSKRYIELAELVTDEDFE